MSSERARGLVLQTRPLTETSLIVNWLTADWGRVSTVAKGALRSRSPFRGKLDLFYLADFTFQRSRRSDLHTLTEVALTGSHPTLRTDWEKLRVACYAAHLVSQATERETPLPGVYDLFVALLRGLEQGPVSRELVLRFEVNLLVDLGLAPDPASTRLGVAARELLGAFISLALDAPSPPAIDPEPFAELDHFLGTFLEHHLGRVPPERARIAVPTPTEGRAGGRSLRSSSALRAEPGRV